MRHVHSLELNHKFIIIGLTGPLRSGCTTTANLLSKNFKREIDYFIESVDEDQRAIEDLYKNLQFAINGEFEPEKIEKTKRDLYARLKIREIKDVLISKRSTDVIRNLTHISMSKMLLKYSIEYYMLNKSDYYDSTFSKLIDLIENAKFDEEIVKNVDELIRTKKFRELDAEKCKKYDRYLYDIEELYASLINEIAPDKLGTILQDIGDNIRRSGIPFKNISEYNSSNVILIAEQANILIKYYRNRQDPNRSHHFVIETFRNPYEVEYFRYRYYEFYLFSIFADKKIRQNGRGQFSKKRDDRDSGSDKRPHELYKQDVTRCVYLSDISINNEETIEKFKQKLWWYYALILQPGCVTPSFHEVFMNEAYALSLKSSCISRQVGAVILGKNGYVVGAGWNDAGEGQVGCGYRQVQDMLNLGNDVLVTSLPSEHKLFKKSIQIDKELSDPICYKDEYSYLTLDRKIEKIMKKPELTKLIKQEQIDSIQKTLLKDIKIKRLEYCRALHAEENALLQSSKIGGVGVNGGTIFTTSFPCELCAKKIYQSGIVEVVYTEPYPDSISQMVILKDGIKRIKLTQFEGVKSHSYFRLYKSNMDRKERIEICRREKKDNTQEPSLF